MHMRMKNNLPLIVGVSIPLLVVVAVALSIYLPGLFVEPQYNFLYTTGDGQNGYYTGYYEYVVRDGKLIKQEVKVPDEIKRNYPPYPPSSEIKFFVHDVKLNKSKQISFDEASRLKLDSNVQSPDGFEVVYGTRDGGAFPFFMSPSEDYHTRYLRGHNTGKKLNVQMGSDVYYDRAFRFVGWILE